MKQTKTIKKEIETEVTTDIICNLCGESCSLGPSFNDERAPYDYNGIIEHTVIGGYNSTPGNGAGALDDSMQYTFSLCEFCLDWLFEKCKIPPRVFCYIDGQTDSWRTAKQRVLEDDWRTQKESFLKEAARRDAARQK
jgi:hypothetical protein